MEIKFNVTRERRKALVTAVSELTGWAAVYKGAPSFAFAVNNYTIDRHGTLLFDEQSNTAEGAHPTQPGTSPRTWWRRDWRTGWSFRFPTPSAWRVLFPCW